MSQALMQYSFHAGELSPALYARVDISKYKSGAALMRNFYPDYRGGASTRTGTRFIQRCKSNGARLIPFQQSTGTNYVLEFGNKYLRFYFNGSPVLESAFFAKCTATFANPMVLNTIANPHGFSPGDWIVAFHEVSNASSPMISGRFFIVNTVPSGTTFTVTDLYGQVIDSSAYTGLPSYFNIFKVYTVPTPYAQADLALLKYAQNANTLLLTHNNYPPMLLTLLTATNWQLAPVVIGATINPPTMGAPSSTLAPGSVNYAYVVTSVDSSGQESLMSTVVQANNLQDIRSVAGSTVINWTAQLGAISYNVYRAEPSYAGVVPSGAAFGFIGNASGTSFVDSNIAPDFSQSPPTVQNPFQGQSVTSFTITANGTYTSAPAVQIGAPAAGGGQATAEALLGLTGGTITNGGSGYALFTLVNLCDASDPNKVPVAQVRPLTTGGGGSILTASYKTLLAYGPGTTVPTTLVDVNGGTLSITGAWGVINVVPLGVGSGYLSAPTVAFIPAGATATANLSTGSSTANPGVSTYFQQRLVMAAPAANPQEFNMSQTGAYFNYNISEPVVASDAIQGSLVSFQLNSIKSMAPMSTGLVVITDKAAWLVNGGSIGAPVSPSQIVATQHSYIGGNDMPPIVINYDILYVQAKGSIVRDLTYNFYAQIYTGTDISILSSHLFYNFKLLQWAYAEEPFKVIWIVRNDGALLSLTYLKEQEIIGWSHHDFLGGTVQSVCTVTESVPFFTNVLSQTTGIVNVDAVYVIVQRTINAQVVQYIERFAERMFTSPQQLSPTVNLAWCVDSGLQGSSNIFPKQPQTLVMDHLKSQTVTGIADGVPFTGTVTGNPPSITSPAASIVTIGFPFTPQLQTLRLDTGEPTSQGKRKKITAVTVRVQDTLGLSIGKSFNSLVPMKDLVKGNLNTPGNFVVNDLVTGDARTLIDPSWDTDGQYCIQQSNPWPATILGVIPELSIGDTPDGGKK